MLQALIVRNNMREKAQNTTERTRIILIATCVSAQENEVLAQLPRAVTLARDIRRQRQRVNIDVPIPNANDLEFYIPREYRVTTSGLEILQLDLQDNGRRL